MRLFITILGLSICSVFFLFMLSCTMLGSDLGAESGGDAGDLDGDGDSDADTDTDSDTDSDSEDSVTGNIVWAKKIGGLEDVKCRSVAALDDDSMILAGDFEATAIFGSGESSETSLSAAGITDVFVAKYNSDGTVAWAKRAGSSGDDGNETAYDITLLAGGSFIATGMYESTATFGAGESIETLLTTAGLTDVFIAKYNSDGTIAWGKTAGGADVDSGKAIEALADGSFLLTGHFSSTATWGAGESVESILPAAGMTDVFLARYNDDGTVAWVKRAGGTGSDEGLDLATASDGTTILVGAFEGTAVFGLGESSETILEADGGTDGFFAKFNPDGTIAWAKRIGGSGQDSVRGVSLLADGSFLVAGHQRHSRFQYGRVQRDPFRRDLGRFLGQVRWERPAPVGEGRFE